ncbi:hypothetical protein QAD02_004066 [Eretmocerus hayati]|uniref:Uncharacterized protein n=1 Tax=Eretmocerus hayati TaxID=131215 RepID=A0ACC2NQB4_9HYME|nr:hypothetical protein QAD02_004066 [Eretmocerus hayati]
MASVFATLSELTKYVNLKIDRDSPAIDNIIFKLHYRATFLILLGSSVLVSSRQFFGEHIKCMADKSLEEDVINSFCFFTSTYTVVKHMNETALKEETIPHPGVGPAAKYDEVTRHAYYQWVPFVLFFQALLFYLPHYIWRTIEGGRLKILVSGLHMASLCIREDELKTDNGVTIISKGQKEAKIKQIRTSFMNRLHINRAWAYYLGLCELLNFVNVLVQIYATNKFLGGSFVGIGKDLVEFDPKNLIGALDAVFPKVTKCEFHRYGPSGGLQRHDVICVMALNIINEKIYGFLWFWFIILAVLTALGLVWRVLTMLFHSKGNFFSRAVFKIACPGKYEPLEILNVTKESHYGDWLFLYYIAKNVENYVFKELLHGLAADLFMKRQNSFPGQLRRDSIIKTEYSPKDEEAQNEEVSNLLY